MMRLRILSDLHLEFVKPYQMYGLFKKIVPQSDEVCILAGDIGNPYTNNYTQFMDYINANFKKTFVIAGNHEYYNTKTTIYDTNKHLTDYFTMHENITFLNNTSEIYEDHCFVGTTLWSKVTNPFYDINDMYRIKFFDHTEYNALNRKCIKFLEDSANTEKNMVVITHHVPSYKLIDNKYKTIKNAPYNQWFYSDMDGFIEKNKDKIKYWIYGHTHTPLSSILYDVPVICNPIGYPGENPKPKYDVTVDI